MVIFSELLYKAGDKKELADAKQYIKDCLNVYMPGRIERLVEDCCNAKKYALAPGRNILDYVLDALDAKLRNNEN